MSTLFLASFGVIFLFLIIWIINNLSPRRKKETPVKFEIEVPKEHYFPEDRGPKVILKGSENGSKRNKSETPSLEKKETKKKEKSSSESDTEKPKKRSYRKYNKKKKDIKKDKGNDLLLS
jgi:hypothetical protein